MAFSVGFEISFSGLKAIQILSVLKRTTNYEVTLLVPHSCRPLALCGESLSSCNRVKIYKLLHQYHASP